MGVFNTLISNTIGFVVTDLYDHHLIRKIRREHDEWMRTVQLNVPYYTVDPTSPARDDMSWTRNIHSSYVFDGRKGQWPQNHQLRATSGALSWDIWFQNGPLTTEWQPTQAHYEAEWDRNEGKILAGWNTRLMGEIDPGARATHERAMADIKRRYPESAKILAGAR